MFANEWGQFNAYHPLMEYNAGFWVSDLGKYLNDFTNDKVPFTALKWDSDDKKEYFSIIANPCGYVVVELIGERIPAKYENTFTKFNRPRMFMSNKRNMKPIHPSDKIGQPPRAGDWTPMKISRATQNMKEVKKYYTKAIHGSWVFDKKYPDGTEHAVWMFDAPNQAVELHFT